MTGFFTKNKFGRLLNWYWKGFCCLHQFWNSPLKFLFELMVGFCFVYQLIKMGTFLLFGAPVFFMPILMDKEIRTLKANLRTKVSKEALKNEVRDMYAQGQELKKLLKVLGVSDFATYSLELPETQASFEEKIEDWEHKGREYVNFKEAYSEFWIRVPDHSELPGRVDRYPDQKIYNIFVWRVEKLGRVLDTLSNEIREL